MVTIDRKKIILILLTAVYTYEPIFRAENQYSVSTLK